MKSDNTTAEIKIFTTLKTFKLDLGCAFPLLQKTAKRLFALKHDHCFSYLRV